MANLVLYRKYRPKSFNEIVGQKHVVQTLLNAIKGDLISHAYLFTGPRGSGKTTIARLLAKAVNCEKPEPTGEPCNTCSSCEDIAAGRAIDFIEIDAASNRGIDEIRELKEGVKFSPTKLKYKVFVIDECLTGDHLISMANGVVKKISDLKNGEKIFSVDINTGRIVPKSISNYFERKTNKILEIKTPQSFLKTTLLHQLWILRDSEFLLTEAKNLKMGDFLLSPLQLPHIQKNNLTPEQLSFLALIQCDGHISKDSITIQVEISKDKDYFEKVFKEGLKAWKIEEKPVITRTKRGTKLLRVYSKKLKNVLAELDCPEGNKHAKIDIPNAVFQAPLASIKAYIDTCFCCEGDIIPFGRPNNINYRLNFSSTSGIFAQKLQLLLKKFGMGSNILTIKKREKRHSTVYRISLSGYDLRIFSSDIGLGLERKNDLLQRFLQKKEKQDCMPIEKLVLTIRREKNIKYSALAPLGIYPSLNQHLTRKSIVNFIKISGANELNRYLPFRYEKIKKIQMVNTKEKVYDFTVEDTHTFIANGMYSSNCHQLTKEAANALLKTLEEPPSHAIFILATTEAHKMIPTIVSRTQRFDFSKLSVVEIIEALEFVVKKEKANIEKSALQLIAQSSGGSIRDALSLLDKVLTYSHGSGIKNKISAELIKELLGIVDVNLIGDFVDLITKKKASEAIELLNKKMDEGLNPQEFAKSLTSYLREALIAKLNHKSEIQDLTKEQAKRMKDQIEKVEAEVLSRMIESFMEAENKMKYASIIQLPLELAIIDSCRIV